MLRGVVRVVVAVRSRENDDGELHRRLRLGLGRQLDAEALDDRIRQHAFATFGGQRLAFGGRVHVQVELEVLALPDVGHRVVAQRVQRLDDGAALRIEDRGLESDEHTRLHGPLIRTPLGHAENTLRENRVDVSSCASSRTLLDRLGATARA